MELRTLICAQGTALDARTNAVSIFNLLEEINAADFPVAVTHVSLFALFGRAENEADPTLLLRVALGDVVLVEGHFTCGLKVT